MPFTHLSSQCGQFWTLNGLTDYMISQSCFWWRSCHFTVKTILIIVQPPIPNQYQWTQITLDIASVFSLLSAPVLSTGLKCTCWPITNRGQCFVVTVGCRSQHCQFRSDFHCQTSNNAGLFEHRFISKSEGLEGTEIPGLWEVGREGAGRSCRASAVRCHHQNKWYCLKATE